MVRQKNEATIQKVKEAAWTLFMKKGYASVSYADLSHKSRIAKSTVQHYFPTKDLLAIACMDALYDGARHIEENLTLADASSFARYYIRGQIYIAALFSGDEIERFIMDVLADRNLTHSTIAHNFQQSFEYLVANGEVRLEETGGDTPDDIIVEMGGLYELIYVCLRDARRFDIPVRIQPPMRVFARLYGISEAVCDLAFREHTLDESKLIEYGIESVKFAAETLCPGSSNRGGV